MRTIEDEAISDLVEKEVAHGLKIVTDGEFRRRWWHLDWLKEYDGFFVEYDDERSGSFEPWAVLKGSDATFVAGLISTKNPELESLEDIKRRYTEAKAVVGNNIALSPQCGFASVEEGNCIDEETQWKKIDLLVSCKDFI